MQMYGKILRDFPYCLDLFGWLVIFKGLDPMGFIIMKKPFGVVFVGSLFPSIEESQI